MLDDVMLVKNGEVSFAVFPNDHHELQDDMVYHRSQNEHLGPVPPGYTGYTES